MDLESTLARLEKLRNATAVTARSSKAAATQMGVPDKRAALLTEQLDELDVQIAEVKQELERMGRNDPVMARLAAATRANHPHPDGPVTVKERDPAMRALDRQVKDGRLPAHAAETVETLLNVGTTAARSWTSRWAATAGSDDYAGAFAKLVANPTQGHLRWTAQEAESFRAVEALRDERRAMAESGGDTGGYMLPTYLDPTILLTSAGSINPLRQISRQVQITTDTWHGVSSAGVTAEWIAESTEVADASPTLAQPSIPVYKADAFVPFSFEVANDALNFTAELQRLLIDGAEQLTATAFTTGSGSGQPTGLITSLVAASTPVVTGSGSEALAAADIYALQNALPPRFQANAVWNANLSILNTARQFETTNGALKFPELSANPPSLLGRNVFENSNMDGSINPAATANNYVLAYGDFSEFVIVHRIGSTLELIPNLFGANHRPTGQRGALLWFRVGSDVVVPNAFRLLNVPTTA
jgi:HK97 family phage major capsid protein